MKVETVDTKNKQVVIDGTTYDYAKNDDTKEIDYFDSDGNIQDFGSDKPQIDAEVKKAEKSLLAQIWEMIKEKFVGAFETGARNKFPIVSNNFYEALQEAVEEMQDANAYQTMVNAQKMGDIQTQLDTIQGILGELGDDERTLASERISKANDDYLKIATLMNNPEITQRTSNLVKEIAERGSFAFVFQDKIYEIRTIWEGDIHPDKMDTDELLEYINNNPYTLVREHDVLSGEQTFTNFKDFGAINKDSKFAQAFCEQAKDLKDVLGDKDKYFEKFSQTAVDLIIQNCQNHIESSRNKVMSALQENTSLTEDKILVLGDTFTRFNETLRSIIEYSSEFNDKEEYENEKTEELEDETLEEDEYDC